MGFEIGNYIASQPNEISFIKIYIKCIDAKHNENDQLLNSIILI